MKIYLVIVTLISMTLASVTLANDHYFPRRYPTVSQVADEEAQKYTAKASGSTVSDKQQPSPAVTDTAYKAANLGANLQTVQDKPQIHQVTGSTIFTEASASGNQAPITGSTIFANKGPTSVFKSAVGATNVQDVQIQDRLPSYAHGQDDTTQPRSGNHDPIIQDHVPQTSYTNQIPQAFNSHSNVGSTDSPRTIPQAFNSHQAPELTSATNYDASVQGLPEAQALTSQTSSSSYNGLEDSKTVPTFPEHEFGQVDSNPHNEGVDIVSQNNDLDRSLYAFANISHLSEQQDRSLKYEHSLNNYDVNQQVYPTATKSQRLFFPSFWFKYYNYPRMACMAAVGMSGTCYTKQQCRLLGGTVYGVCARGYGVCCIVRRTCGAVTSLNRTYFSNPEYPGSSMNAGGSCTLVLTRPSRPRICQVRLDFHEFQLMPPQGGDCVRDRFVVQGQNPNNIIPALCGVNSGQHMYFDIDQLRSPFALTVHTSGQGQRRWNIAVTYIDCYSSNKAPANCLQYYEGPNGYFRSFNYMPTAPVAMTGGYLNNLNYAVCFRREMGACAQTYMTNSSVAAFDIMNVNDNNAPTLGNAEAGLGLVECPNDFIELGGLRYCGTRLNPSLSPSNPNFDAPVVDDTTGPFMVKVVTNAVVNGIGYQIGFTQNPCTIRYPGVHQQNGR